MRLAALGLLGLSLLVPATAFAGDVTVSLAGATIPVGPVGTTVLDVARTAVAGERFAVIRARAPELPTPCGVAPERVAVWGLLESHWTEMVHEVIDRCPAVAPRARRTPYAVRARIVEVVEAGVHRAEFAVRVVNPALPPEQSPVVRYHREGDRFVVRRAAEVLAATPGVVPRSLTELAPARVDGRLDEWGGLAPMATGDRGSLWMAQRGDALVLAADLATGESAPTLTLHLADPVAGTAQVRGTEGNAGRVVRLACDSVGARCERVGERWHLEGSVALGAQIYRNRTLDAVQMLALAEADGRRVLSTSAGLRLETTRLARPIDLLRGATPEVVARCDGGYLGRVSPPGATGGESDPLRGALVTCGGHCHDGYCERLLGTGDVAGRLEWSRQGTCLRGTGPGGLEVDGCRSGASSRLVGAVAVQGFDLVVGVERTFTMADTRWRQGELWALVTASARWQRLRLGTPQRGARPIYARMELRDGHPSLCGDTAGGACEVFGDLTLSGRERASESVTGELMATMRGVGLAAHGGKRSPSER